MKYKDLFNAVCGVLGSALAFLFGPFNGTVLTLIIFMTADYLSGFIIAAVFKKSPKSKTGALESHAGWKGLVRKGVTLIIVMLSFRLNELTGLDFIADGVIIAFIVNEAISITENAALIGIPLPAVLTRAIDILKTNEET